MKEKDKTRINEQIRAREVRVIDPQGGNLGVLSIEDALGRARALQLDLIEVSPGTVPPIVRITDYGKYQYDTSKKLKDVKAKAKVTETKSLQVKLGTGDNDLEIKARQASKWLKEGHRVQFDLYLRGREKYLEENFLKGRLERVLILLTEDYKIAEPVKKTPKGGFMVTIERKK